MPWLIALALVCWPWHAAVADTHGLVIGVSDYAAYGPFVEGASLGTTYDLLGARNDAEQIAQAMRDTGVRLPESRVLLDNDATLNGFLHAWGALLDSADPGDTLIITFAGHGAQEREMSEPFDETDKRDEIVMFHDFDPDNPHVGRLTDDALYTLFEQASDYDIYWVADSCHSGGLSRSMGRTLTRFGGLFDGLPDPGLAVVPIPRGDADKTATLPHVTQILATASEDLLVTEIEIEGRVHGALSWYFAQALRGAADDDQNGQITRAELAAYLDLSVFAHMNQTQQPRILPAADDRIFLSQAAGASVEPDHPAPTEDTRLPVTVLGPPPPGLPPEDVREVALGAALRFEAVNPTQWRVYNVTGDLQTIVDTSGSPKAKALGYATSAAPLVTRARTLAHLNSQIATGPSAPRVVVKNGIDALPLNSRLRISFQNERDDYPFLTLFNLASNGDLQSLGDEKLSRGQLNISFQVVPPTGADQLFGAFCQTPPRDLQDMLRRLHGKPMTQNAFANTGLDRCLLAKTGLFTVDATARKGD